MISKKHCIPYQISMDWGQANILEPLIQKQINFDPIKKNEVGFIFDDVQLHLDDKNYQYIETKYIGFNIQPKLPDQLPKDIDGNSIGTLFIGYNNRLRGFINKDQDTKALIFANISGSTRIFEFPYGQEIGDQFEKGANPDFIFDLFSIMNISPEGDPQQYPILEPYNVQLLIVVERKDFQSSISLVIDKIDVEATYSAPNDR